MVNLHNYSVVPPTGTFGSNWPKNANITQGLAGSLSVAGWTYGNEGFEQQSFLGASIRSFNVNAGFGDSSSTMGIELVNDEFNKSDKLGFGKGDDLYHNGIHDNFNPPVVGAPVFFKFGKNFADVEQAFRKDFDQIYGVDTLRIPNNPFPIVNDSYPIQTQPKGYYLIDSDPGARTSRWVDKTVLLDPTTNWRGFAHFTFGGILQSYTENQSSAGNPLYSVKLTDPREILSNAELVFNNYQGTTFNNKNLFNIYGFLEHDPSDALIYEFDTKKLSKTILEKKVDDVGKVTYTGQDEYIFPQNTVINSLGKASTLSGVFPITGQGFSRRGENGIPWYRVQQAMTSLFSYDSNLPKEYQDAGFGGVIDFRGYNYVVDFRGIPTEEIPNTYYLDFDNLNMLDLAQELCDVLSRELYVSLLPVIDHPACSSLFKKNKEVIAKASALPANSPERALILGSELIAGIIRIDSIDKKKQPRYGAVKQYLDNLEANDVFVESRDVGFEVSNVTTDKFVVGAQEVDMYYFNNLRDRDNYFESLKEHGDPKGVQRLKQLGHDKWTLDTNLKQQILPFYGFIGDKAVTIPRGFGSYQQIMLDARGFDAHGVGSYYVATEMELRAATVSYKAWQNFLLTYNEVYIQELSESQAFLADIGMDLTAEVAGVNTQIDPNGDIKKQLDILTEAGRNFGVSVPRSVWNSDKSAEIGSQQEDDPETGEPEVDANGDPIITETGGQFEGKMGDDGYPASPCNPPFGYPLYYKRAEKIGIPQAGLTQITGSLTTVITNIGNLEDLTRSDKQRFSYIQSMAEKSIRRLNALVAQKIETRDKSTEAQKIDAINEEIKTLKARVDTIRANLVKEKEEIKALFNNRKIQIAALKTIVKNSAGLIKNISKTQRDSLNNAKKVYNFVKKIADDNLGKKFLVKIPRACNVNWSAKIKQAGNKPWDVVRGPFGFQPQPVSSIPGYKRGAEWMESLREFKRVAKMAERTGPTPNIMPGSIWPTKSNIHWHYLDLAAMGQASAGSPHPDLTWYGSGYTNGALKCNFNPMSEKWEHNYQPEPQGGFFNFALFDRNLKEAELNIYGISNTYLPAVTKNVLAPMLMDKIVSDGNRIKCYARYDHSQHLDFSSVSLGSVEQQAIGPNGTIIPDVMETLPNLRPDIKESLNSIEQRLEDDKEGKRQEKSVAFVQCEIDERFYMAPKHKGGEAVVWAEDFTVNLAATPYEIVYIDGTGDSLGCKVPTEVKRRPIPSFGVKDGGFLNSAGESSTTETVTEEDDDPIAGNEGETEIETPVGIGDAHKVPWDDFEREYSKTHNGWIIKTAEKDLDSEHVYALITVPGRITPTVDKRYVDGPLKSINGVSIANALTEDVVKIDEFKKPGIPKGPGVAIDCADPDLDLTFKDISRAIQAQKDAMKGISLSSNGNNSILAFTSPSPIYPDLVALPLMSLERCYGPWLSSALDGNMLGLGDVRYSDIGGKVEFQKEEGLSPWSFAGYQLMDEAAKMKTKFSNSMMLLSERGSFSYADAPIDVSLARALQNNGPLVTSISVSVGSSIKTSVKLDLYTSQFGKLQKQKELAISQISRERQKMIDQSNLLKRRGIGKGAANMNMLGTLMENGGQKLLDAAKSSTEIFTELEKGNVQKPSMITVSATPRTEVFDANGVSTSIVSADSEGCLQSESQIQEMASLSVDEDDFNKTMSQTAGASVSDVYSGVSDDPNDPNFASRRPNVQIQRNKRTYG